jgi:glycosyltransferase involved in cell wall biosynthesis
VGRALGADLIHSVGYTGPLLSVEARVTTIHDMNYRRHRADFSVAERAVYGALIPAVARRSRRIVAASQASRVDISRWTGVPPKRISVVYFGVREQWPGDPADDVKRIATLGVRPPFVLSVAAAYPHKNVERLIRAFPLDDEQQVGLVLVGMRGRASTAITTAAHERHNLVTLLGWIDDAMLATLYRKASALALPSLHEGFGLPIVEAMALGTPVLTSNHGAMAEVAGDAAELVEPQSVEAIRHGLQRVVFDEGWRSTLIERGLERAKNFTWQRTAEGTLAVYRQALVGN